MKSALKATEDRVLCLMSNAQGNILDDEELINTLSASKATSVEMAAKVRAWVYDRSRETLAQK